MNIKNCEYKKLWISKIWIKFDDFKTDFLFCNTLLRDMSWYHFYWYYFYLGIIFPRDLCWYYAQAEIFKKFPFFVQTSNWNKQDWRKPDQNFDQLPCCATLLYTKTNFPDFQTNTNTDIKTNTDKYKYKEEARPKLWSTLLRPTFSRHDAVFCCWQIQVHILRQNTGRQPYSIRLVHSGREFQVFQTFRQIRNIYIKTFMLGHIVNKIQIKFCRLCALLWKRITRSGVNWLRPAEFSEVWSAWKNLTFVF